MWIAEYAHNYDVYTYYIHDGDTGLAFLVYRLIPLLPELRETMDWTFTNTSLSLINWFKVQEIYSLIYLVKVQRTREKVSDITHLKV